jgi:hypothetical protein
MVKRVLSALIIIFLLTGCVSEPQSETVKPPDWVLSKPDDDDNYMYFTGTGTSNTGHHEDAKNAAISGLLAEIMQYIGVTVTTETEAVAQATLDEFQAEITQTVIQESEANVSGFEVTETWIDERSTPAVTIHILGRYSRAELNKEKARLEALFTEKIEAISGPEEEGLELFEQGRFYEAAIKFITAAGAAANSDLANADIKFKRNISQAMSSIEQINIIKINDNITEFAGSQLEQFKAKIVTGGSINDPGVPDAVVLISYRELYAPTNRLVFRNQSIKTDNDGMAVFSHPLPEFTGPGEVSFSLDLSAYLDELQNVPDEYYDLVHGLEVLIAKKNVIFNFEVISNAANIKTGIFIINYGENDFILNIQDSASGLASVLTDFNLVVLMLSPAELGRLNTDEMVYALKDQYSDVVDRLLFGTVKVENTSVNSNRYFAEVTGTVRVWDLDSDTLIYTVNMDKNGMGGNQEEALLNANREIGIMFGNDIRNNLR